MKDLVSPIDVLVPLYIANLAESASPMVGCRGSSGGRVLARSFMAEG